MADFDFDVFLSHNGSHKPLVRELKKLLAKARSRKGPVLSIVTTDFTLSASVARYPRAKSERPIGVVKKHRPSSKKFRMMV